tara:strand:+ start:203 stop:490 length:288 start_codon:yes stop_codon:yes gene_type:complete
MKKFSTKQQIMDFIGHESVLEFQFMSDGVVGYKTVMPELETGNYYHYEIEFFFESLSECFRFDNFSSFLRQLQIHTVIEVETKKELYFSTYNKPV